MSVRVGSRLHRPHNLGLLAATALEKPGQAFAALAIVLHKKGGTNEQVVNRMTEQGVFKIFKESQLDCI